MDCANDDDDHRSQKLADSREHAAPWQATLRGGPMRKSCVSDLVLDIGFNIQIKAIVYFTIILNLSGSKKIIPPTPQII